MIVNRTKALLREGRVAAGAWVLMGDPTAIEVAGLAGLDFVIVDMEHTTRDIETIEHMARAADVVNLTLIVRVPGDDEKLILRVLETGVQGIAVPGIETAEQAARVVSSVRYPLAGTRGVCSMTRASRYGTLRPRFAEYVESADREILLIGLIETAAGVENIEGILDAGLEVAFVGRRDLSGSLGVHGHAEHPKVLEAQSKILAAVHGRNGTAWAGLVPFTSPETGELTLDGATFIANRNDISLLYEAYQSGAARVRALGEQDHPAAAGVNGAGVA